MDNNLEVLNLYNEADSNKVDNFSNKINSSLHVKTDYNKVETNYEWLDKIEETLPYLDNILRNPNRFIINEEDVVKVELAKRITVDSIKHLSRNTNLIQEYNKKTGDIKPSKILNINKEESFDTYENRFIYSLIKNIQFFIERKKRNIVNAGSCKNNKNLEYNSSVKMDGEDVNISLMIDAKSHTSIGSANINEKIKERISKVELLISDLTNSDVFKSIAKTHCSLVTSPIKKTNVILKNVNFQYAVVLWNYLQTHTEDNEKQVKENKSYEDNSILKKYLDETVLLDYLVADTINSDKSKAKKAKKEVAEKIAANMVQKLMDVNDQISEEDLKNLISKQYTIIKYKIVENDIEIQKRFKKHIDAYMDRISKVRI